MSIAGCIGRFFGGVDRLKTFVLVILQPFKLKHHRPTHEPTKLSTIILVKHILHP